MTSVPEIRIRTSGDGEVNSDGDFVLYWMVANRRTTWNFSLQRAVDWARDLGKPLVVFEALRTGYRWASDRLHYFVIQGMADNARRLEGSPVTYYPYLEPKAGAGKGLLAKLASRACVVLSDDYPCFFLPRMLAAAESQISVRFELVDSNGLLPMRAADKVFARAFDLRRFLQKNLRPHLDEFPDVDPLENIDLTMLDGLPKDIAEKWPTTDVEAIAEDAAKLKDFPIDHDVAVSSIAGGAKAGRDCLRDFIANKLAHYDERNDPDQDASSGLSPYLHFGHVSAHQVFSEVMAAEDWDVERIADEAKGKSSGWWGTSEALESFVDELITWRELGFNMCWQQDDFDQYDSLPDWARETLADHEDDPREDVYSLEEFEAAETHDELWNAAQRQLTTEGKIHNYLRMLWGKKILQWTACPRDALDVMIELNNKYALDGRDPNSYSGIFWVLGRYDRPWGPERPIYGKIRYMTSENTARKFNVSGYLERYAAE